MGGRSVVFITFRKLDAQEAELNAIGTGERERFEKQYRKGASLFLLNENLLSLPSPFALCIYLLSTFACSSSL